MGEWNRNMHHYRSTSLQPNPTPNSQLINSSGNSVVGGDGSGSGTIPFLGMLIDRTSFDETDDYGVDQDLIKPVSAVIQGAPFPSNQEQHQHAPTMVAVMRDGKVRRRLRWRPKVPKSKKQQQYPPSSVLLSHGSLQQQRQYLRSRIVRGGSCNNSVMSGSNFSQTSKQSKKSLHSFASTETAAMSNLRKDRKLSLPLPRPPSYPTSSNPPNQEEVVSPSSSITSVRSTIGTEGGLVHARIVTNNQRQQQWDENRRRFSMSSSSYKNHGLSTNEREHSHNEDGDDAEIVGIEMIPADDGKLNKNKTNNNERDDTDGDTVSETASCVSQLSPLRSEPLEHHHRTSKSGLGLPPLFKRKPFSKSNSNRRELSPPPRGDASVVSGLSLGSFLVGPSESILPAKHRTEISSGQTKRLNEDFPSLVPVISVDDEREHLDSDNDNQDRSDLLFHSGGWSRIEANPEVYGCPDTYTREQTVDDLLPSIALSSSIDEETNTSPSSFLQFNPTASPSDSLNPFNFLPSSIKAVFNVETLMKVTGNNSSTEKSKKRESNKSDLGDHIDEESKIVLPQQPHYYEGRLAGTLETPVSYHNDVTNPQSNGSLMSSETPESTNQQQASSTTKKARCMTGPVDVDDGAFLEAEKNLHAIHEMAIEHLNQGEYTEALEVFEEILRGQLARYGEDHYRVGTALHNIGLVHMRRGDYCKAVVVYKEAVRIRKRALGPDHPDIAVSLAQLGVAYLESQKHGRSIGAFREALRIRRKSLGNHHPKVAKILNNIGCALYELDELEVARVAFEEARDIQRYLLRTQAENAANNTMSPSSVMGDDMDPLDNQPSSNISDMSLLSIASTQSNIASIKLFCGQYEEAIIDLEEALLIQQCVLGDDHPLARRTEESLLWLENQRSLELQQQHGNVFDLTDNHGRLSQSSSDQKSFYPSSSLNGNMSSTQKSPLHRKDRRPTSPSHRNNSSSGYLWNGGPNVSQYSPTDFLLPQSVYETIERGIRKLSADLDYMSCGTVGSVGGISSRPCGGGGVDTTPTVQVASSSLSHDGTKAVPLSCHHRSPDQSNPQQLSTSAILTADIPVDRRSSF